MQDIDNLQLVAKDILFMDIGTGVETAFKWGTKDDEAVVEYMIEDEQAEYWGKGHIHSHHNMSVFFSTTDVSELNDNSPLHNVYLSLIVNNAMDMKARVAFVSKTVQFEYRDFDGKVHSMELEGQSQMTMFWYECDVQLPEEVVLVSKTFEERFEEVKARPRSVPTTTQAPTPTNQNWKAPTQSTPSSSQYRGYGDNLNNSKIHSQPEIPNWKWDDKDTSIEEKLQEMDDKKISEEESFLCYLLRLGEEYSNDTLDDVLNDIEESYINVESLKEAAELHFFWHYNEFFKGHENHGKFEHINSILEFAQVNLEHHVKRYDCTKTYLRLFKKLETEFINKQKELKDATNTHKTQSV